MKLTIVLSALLGLAAMAQAICMQCDVRTQYCCIVHPIRTISRGVCVTRGAGCPFGYVQYDPAIHGDAALDTKDSN